MCSGRPVSYDLEQAFAEMIIGGDRSFVVTADEPAQFKLTVQRAFHYASIFQHNHSR